jgi:hypothetical protein
MYVGKKRCIQGFGGGDLTENDHLDDLCVDGRILKLIFKKWDVGAQAALLCLRIKTSDVRLSMRQGTFGFHKIRRIYWLVEDLIASQKGLCYIELWSYSLIVVKCLMNSINKRTKM